MFTGIITGVGMLAERTAHGGDARLRIGVGSLPWSGGHAHDSVIGESIAVNGVCLTVVGF